MSAVLISCAFKKLSFIIGFHRSRSCENLGTSHQMQFHMAFHTDASAEISAGRQNHSSSTMSHAGINSGIDSMMVENLSIADGTEIFHIVVFCLHACHSKRQET